VILAWARDRAGERIHVDGASVGDITETSLKDRRLLGSEGFISVRAFSRVIPSSKGTSLAIRSTKP